MAPDGAVPGVFVPTYVPVLPPDPGPAVPPEPGPDPPVALASPEPLRPPLPGRPPEPGAASGALASPGPLRPPLPGWPPELVAPPVPCWPPEPVAPPEPCVAPPTPEDDPPVFLPPLDVTPVSPPEDPPVDGCGVEVCDPHASDMERMASTANPVGSNFRMGTSSFGPGRDRLFLHTLAVTAVWQRCFVRDGWLLTTSVDLVNS